MADLGRADSGELPGRDLVMNLHRTPPRPRRRGFNLIEVLIALAITATLLTATLAALDASFRAYQATTEEVSTQSIGRIVMHRMLTLIRTGTDFGPFPLFSFVNSMAHWIVCRLFGFFPDFFPSSP